MNDMQKLEAGAHAVAVSEIGHGEPNSAMNNRGSDVERYRRMDGTGAKVVTKNAWCGVFVSYIYMTAAGQQAPRVAVPFPTSRGAKALTKKVAAAGRWVVAPGNEIPSMEDLDILLKPGQVICFNRGLASSWTGHVGIIHRVDMLSGYIISIEGNLNNRSDGGGRYAVVDYQERDWFTIKKKLFGIASIAPKVLPGFITPEPSTTDVDNDATGTMPGVLT